MKMRRFPHLGAPLSESTGTGRDLRQVPAETKRLVRLRADGKCEACQSDLGDGGTCSTVCVVQAWSGNDIDSGPANTVLLCDPCRARVEALDTEMEARGMWVWSGPDPRLMPMIIAGDEGSWRPVWR